MKTSSFMRLFSLAVSLIQVLGVLRASTGQVTSNLSAVAQISLASNASSISPSNRSFLNVITSKSCVYTLSSNNSIQVWTKSLRQSSTSNLSQYCPSSDAFSFYKISLDEVHDLLLAASWVSSTLSYVLFDISDQFNPSLLRIITNHTISTRPSDTFLCSDKIYSYFRVSSGVDWLQVVDIMGLNTWVYSLPRGNSSFQPSPNCKVAVGWSKNLVFYFYSLIEPVLELGRYNQSSILSLSSSVSFSKDGDVAIIQTGFMNPLVLYSLINYTSIRNTRILNVMQQTTFLDEFKRFVLVSTFGGRLLLYDSFANKSSYFNETLNGSFVVDYQSNSLFVYSSTKITSYGISIKDGDVWVCGNASADSSNLNNSSFFNDSSNSTFTNSSTYVPSNASSPSFVPQNNKSQHFNAEFNEQSFFMMINMTDYEQKASQTLSSTMIAINNIVQNIIRIVFSSPFTCFFLGFLNYFNLTSLYVLLNVKIPVNVYSILKIIYNSINTGMLNYIGLQISITPLSAELISDIKPLYFNLSSDFFMINYLNIASTGFNLAIYEFLLRIKKKLAKDSVIRQFVKATRYQTISGLIISNMILVILPWKFILFGQGYDIKTKVNIIVPIVVVGFLFGFMGIHFLQTVSAEKKHIRNLSLKTEQIHHFNLKKVIKEWLLCFQNILYPMLVLLNNPIYYIIAIGSLNMAQIYLSFHEKECKFMSIFTSINSFIFHLCFVIFQYFDEYQSLLVNASIICLSSLVFNSCINIFIFFYRFLKYIYKFCRKRCCKSNSVSDDTTVPQKDIEKHQLSDRIHNRINHTHFQQCINNILYIEDAQNQERTQEHFKQNSNFLSLRKKTMKRGVVKSDQKVNTIRLKVTFKRTD